MDQAGQERGAADDSGWRHRGVASLEQFLHGVEYLAVDDRGHGNDHDLADRLQLLGLGPLVELVLAPIGAWVRMRLTWPMPLRPPSRVKMRLRFKWLTMFLTPHLAGRAIAMERQPIDQTHGVGVQRIDRPWPRCSAATTR